jgi:RNA polymerase-interacting CarD/CdnL/TRCF family regulator
LAEIVESLTELNEIKALSLRDRQTLDQAKKFLICEISEVMGEAKNASEDRLEKALKRKKNPATVGSNSARSRQLPV